VRSKELKVRIGIRIKMRKELNSKDVEELAVKIESQFGFRIDEKLKYFVKEEKEGEKIFIFSGNRIPNIQVEWIGLHFGTLIQNEFQPSIDGAFLMQTANKKILQASKKEIEELMKGSVIDYSGGLTGFVIARHKDLACVGIVKEGKVGSLTPKSRLI